MRLVLFEPDIPQNTGVLLRLGACLGVAVDIVEPCGLLPSDRRPQASARPSILERSDRQRFAAPDLCFIAAWILATSARVILSTRRHPSAGRTWNRRLRSSLSTELGFFFTSACSTR